MAGGIAKAATSRAKAAELSPALFLPVTVTVYVSAARLFGAFTVRADALTVKPDAELPLDFFASTETAMGSAPVKVYKVWKAVPC